MKKWLAVLLVTVIGVSLMAGILEEIKARGYIVMGTEATFPPFEFRNEKNEVVGFDIDIGKKIAEALGVELRIVDMPFDSLIPSLITKKIDIAIAAMTITEERKKSVNFSDPYFKAGQVIVVRRGAPAIKTLEELKGKKVAVQQGTTGDLIVSEIEGVKISRFARFTDAFLELMNGRVDAVVLDFAPARAYVAMYPQLVITSDVLSEEEYGIAVRKEDTDLLEFINSVLRNMKKSPYDLLVEKWFSE
ncbi:MAG: arginine/lysine/histidine transporter system substrate-binding protein [Thermotogota bacterium]|nr:arginine/lysine/histidine transporter system substrate-binding protein [Thermotogota bacterium]HCZ06997.1 basic amino acid ABC transporter substrate-binding protein [Thermotogota bacterium]